MAALHGTIAFAEMDAIPVIVGQNLELDVARMFQVFLHVDRVVLKRRERFGFSQLDGVLQGGFRVHHAHATTAAAGGGFNDDGVTDAARELDVLRHIVA